MIRLLAAAGTVVCLPLRPLAHIAATIERWADR